MNKAVLIGRLTKDPELTTTPSGTPVCKFSLAVNRKFLNSSGERETDFLNIVVWRGAENCHKYLRKGSKCGVLGMIQTRSYEAQDGTRKYITEIVADEVEFLSPKNQIGGESFQNNAPQFQTQNQSVSELEPIDDDSLPF